jgi:hypothetical protein
MVQAGAAALDDGLVVTTFNPGGRVGTLTTNVTYGC